MYPGREREAYLYNAIQPKENISNPYESFGYKDGDEVAIGDGVDNKVYVLKLEGKNTRFVPLGNASREDGEKISVDPKECVPYRVKDKARVVQLYENRLLMASQPIEVVRIMEYVLRSGLNLTDIGFKSSSTGMQDKDRLALLRLRLVKAQLSAQEGNMERVDEELAVFPRKGELREVLKKLIVNEAVAQRNEQTTKERREYFSKALYEMYSQEIVQVFDSEKNKPLLLQKIDETHYIPFTPPNEDTLKTPQYQHLMIYPHERVIDMILARPSLFRIEKNEMVRAVEQRRREVKQSLDKAPSHSVVTVGRDTYEKIDGEFQIMGEEAISVKTLGLFFISLDQLAARAVADYAHFKIEAPDIVALPEVREDDREAMHGRFAKALPDLYPIARIGLVQRVKSKIINIRDRVEQYIAASETRQGYVGDCYLLAAINTLKNNKPDLYFDVLARSIRSVGNGVWQVRFLGMDKEEMSNILGQDYNDGWITVTDNDIKNWERRYQTKGDKADIILERAYASYAALLKHRTRGKTFALDAEGEIALEGGHSHRALHVLIGSEVVKKRTAYWNTKSEQAKSIKIRNVYSFLKQVVNRPQDFLLTAHTHMDSTYIQGQNRFKIDKEHAYSVLNCRYSESIKDFVLFIEDPRDPSNRRFHMSGADFMHYFSGFDYAEIKAKYKRESQMYEV